MNLKSLALGALGLAVAAAAAPAPASAQNWPARPITMIVPFAAGGPTDTVARLIAQVMSEDLGQRVTVENVGGAGGTLGAGRVARAANDGHTIFLHHIGMATSATLYRQLPYDTLRDFETIGLVTDVPMTIISRRDFAPNTLQELVAHMRQNGDRVTLANAGIGAASHLCGMLIQSALGVQVTTVPYNGTGPAMTDIVGGRVDVMCDQTTNTTQQINAGTVKAFAVTTPDRVASLPNLPTVVEAGLPNVQVAVWHGLYAPRGTAQPIIERLSQSLQKALQADSVKTRFAELGTAPVALDRATPAAHRAHLEAEIARWRPIIQAAGQFAD